MNNVYQHYIIDLSSNNNFVQIPTVQGDGNNIRGFEVELFENGVQYEIDKNDCLVAIMGTKPDTSQIMNDCTVSDEGYILVDITSQMSAVKGRGDYQIVLMSRSTNSQLKSFPFHILTTPATFDIDYIVSSDEFQTLTRNIVRTEEVIEEANDTISDVRALEDSVEKAEKARVDAEEKRVSAENIRIKNEDIRQNNETIRQDNETVRQSNETMRESSEDTRRSNESDRQIAETARISVETDRVNAENVRETNEDIRIENENARKTVETKRDDAENIRIDNESVRQSNESIRESNESDRQTNTATAISNAEKATDNANAAAEKARVAGEKATAAETTAIEKAAEAGNYAKMAQSYAVGTGDVRPNESTDNAKYYSEQSKSYADSWKGSLLPKGTIAFSQLPTSDNVAGHMYNISDAFETDSRFKDGAGYAYAAGTNVYWTADEKWDCLSGTITMELTMAEYNALSDAQKMNGTIYYISDADNSISSATENFDGLMSHADKQKLDGIEDGANAYSLPLATESVRGGVKVGYTQNGNNYPVQLNDDEQMYVNVPWTNTNTQTLTGVKGSAETSYRTGDVEITPADIGLENVDDTSDIDKPVSTAQQEAIDAAYQQATGYTNQKIAELINGAPETLDTLGEIAQTMEDNDDVVEALQQAIGSKASQAEFDGHTSNDTIHIKASERQSWNDKQTKTGDIQDNIVTFESGDAIEPTGLANVALVTTKEKMSSLMRKLSLTVKNMRYVFKLIGNNQLSIGDGTITGAINELNTGLPFGGRTYATYNPTNPRLAKKHITLPDAFKNHDVNNFFVALEVENEEVAARTNHFVIKSTGSFDVHFRNFSGTDMDINTAIWFSYIVVVRH